MTLAAALGTTANATAQQDTLELPFFDDFSYLSDVPADSLWVTHGATICYDLPNNPPSTGALLLDALNGKGVFYANARYGTTTAADTVESQPINLDYPGEKSIWLSFYYQREASATALNRTTRSYWIFTRRQNKSG